MAIDNVKQVRERSGAPLGECKSALDEAGGDIDAALVVLQKRGTTRAVARGGRIASEGRVYSYIHGNGTVGVLVEVNCETDFVARNPDFVTFCEEVGMQIAAMNPQWVRREEISVYARHTQALIFEGQLVGKAPPQAFAKILEGKFNKWYSEVCLMDQELVTGSGDTKQTVDQRRIALVATLGENIVVRRFVRFERGEGIEKKSVDFVSEVAKLSSDAPGLK